MIVIILYFAEKYKQKIIAKDWIQDDFAVGNLDAQVNWNISIPLVGILYILGMIYFVWFCKKTQRQWIGIFAASLFFISFLTFVVVPRVEKYTQNAAIEFYKNRVGEDCYVTTYGFKSYAHYFYTKMPDHSNPNSKDISWLLSGNADKSVYVVCKNVSQKHFEKNYPYFEYLYAKNGFVFYISKKKE